MHIFVGMPIICTEQEHRLCFRHLNCRAILYLSHNYMCKACG